MAGDECLALEENGDRYRLASIASYLAVILIGLPIWWKTTEVYRVSLPYDNIHKLAENRLTLPVTVTVLCEDPVSSNLLAELRNDGRFELGFPKFDLKVNWRSRQCDQSELEILSKSSDVSEADVKFSHKTLSGNITVIVLSKSSTLFSNDIYIGAHRTVFIKNSDALASDVVSVVDTIVNPIQLQQSYNRLINRKFDKNDKESIKSISSSPSVDVTFTLILPEASLINVTWDIENAIDDYLQPFAGKFERIANLNVRSQIFYLTLLDVKTKYNPTLKHHVLSADQLPHLINPIEIKLGSHVNNDPALNFVIYVSPAHQTPLRIYDSNEIPSELNSMLIPRWGGLMVYNIDRSQSQQMSIDMRHVFGVFLVQLRSLFGIPHRSNIDGRLTFGVLGPDLIRDWEFDSVLRMRLVENLLKATTTLNSLAELLEQISNIVIADHVGEQIFDATRKIDESYSALSEGDVTTAFQLSKSAVIASEAAFFDPSMLALLYFPEDQKYAIYVPLFAPISVSLVISIVSVIKWWKKRRQTTENEDKSKSD